MRRKRVYVKPVMAGGVFGWVVLELTLWESFWDDWRRYGLRVAVYNWWRCLLWWMDGAGGAE